MGLGILEDHHLAHVPGTSLFRDDPNAAALAHLAQITRSVPGKEKETKDASDVDVDVGVAPDPEKILASLNLSKLKHAKGKHSHIVLVPQPSDDPNDPLNWPRWKKHLVFFVLVYGTTICGALGPLVSADIVAISIELSRSLQAISRALGSALVLALALSTVVWSALSIKLGKRPVFLASTVFMFVGAMVGGFTKDYNMLLGSRILQGIGQAVLEFLVGASIADIYFTHERGIPVALWNLALLDGINITPPIAGQVVSHLGWRWCFRIFAISCAVLFFLQFFFMPETTYHRTAPSLTLNSGSNNSDSKLSDHHIENSDPESLRTHPSAIPLRKKKTYWEELKVYNGIYPSSVSFTTLLIRPFVACLTPVCLWAGLLYGVAITWLVLIATSVAQIFSAAPYNFTPSNIGLTYMSPFIFAFIAALLCGPLTNFAARRMSKLNGGIFEPEFRLVLVSFYAVFGSMGFFGWGISANLKDPWIGPVIFFGLINFGITIGCSAAIGYVVDAHRQSADSALGGVIFFKNIFSFIITFFINDWFSARGILNVFGIVGGLTMFTSLLTIPMYIYGKRARSWIHRTVKFDEDETNVVAH